MPRSKPQSPLMGRWRIVSMSAWEDDYLDEEVQAFIEFADGTELTGRGWAKLNGDELNGMFCIHEGDDSEFVAKRVTAKKATKRK